MFIVVNFMYFCYSIMHFFCYGKGEKNKLQCYKFSSHVHIYLPDKNKPTNVSFTRML